jgi:hypothetical protein
MEKAPPLKAWMGPSRGMRLDPARTYEWRRNRVLASRPCRRLKPPSVYWQSASGASTGLTVTWVERIFVPLLASVIVAVTV